MAVSHRADSTAEETLSLFCTIADISSGPEHMLDLTQVYGANFELFVAFICHEDVIILVLLNLLNWLKLAQVRKQTNKQTN